MIFLRERTGDQSGEARLPHSKQDTKFSHKSVEISASEKLQVEAWRNNLEESTETKRPSRSKKKQKLKSNKND